MFRQKKKELNKKAVGTNSHLSPWLKDFFSLFYLRFVHSKKYAITQEDEEDMLNKMDAFAGSKMHNKTHSIQLVLVTTMGLAKGEHSSIVNQTVVLEDLFK